MISIVYRLSIPEPSTHVVHVEMQVDASEPLTALVLFMPVWTPGSYLVREYARHVEGFGALAPTPGASSAGASGARWFAIGSMPPS
jgi:predicted metalloprotease with PDZ domain